LRKVAVRQGGYPQNKRTRGKLKTGGVAGSGKHAEELRSEQAVTSELRGGIKGK
jgi:hypothetical protein